MKPVSLLSLTLLALFTQTADAASNPLKFFSNWFLTGDYASAGVGLQKTAGVGTINMSNVPCILGTGAAAAVVSCTTAGSVPAYPIAAFLYWETVESTPGAPPANTVNGTFDSYPIVGQLVGSDSSSACWLPPNQKQTLKVYRADVLRDLLIDPSTSIRLANGAHAVAVGNGYAANTGVLETLGASLVVIYRLVAPGKPQLAPFKAIVIVDGENTMMRTNSAFNQTIPGIYQSSSTNPATTMSLVVGGGNMSTIANLEVNGQSVPGVSYPSFTGNQGPAWDNVTSSSFQIYPNAASFVTTSQLNGTTGCLAWAAVVASTNVQNSDNDGLLDVWKQEGLHLNTQTNPATFGACDDYPHDPCVDLPNMGAKLGQKDVFLQLDWMHGKGDGTGGTDGSGTHDHIPPLASLTMVANAFAAHNIHLHFDVGNNYQGLGLPYIVPYSAGKEILALGGADIDESTLVCYDMQGHICDYHEPYPVISFKFGLASIRDGNTALNIAQHFATARRLTHHYVLIAHALAGPYNPNGTPTDTNPKSISGISDRPGGDLMITLGLWRSVTPAYDMVGSPLTVAGTFMHELGHNLDLSHGGLSSTPNCMPNYPSVMSYLYQTRGLTDASGVEHIDYSNGLLSSLNESSLSSNNSMGALQYRVRFYGPVGPNNSPGQAAQVHCDGTAITTDTPLIRLETPTVAVPDWTNGTLAPGTKIAVDANFDGIQGEIFHDQPDWASLNLQEVGSRPYFGSLSNGVSATDAGIAATDAGVSATDAGISATDAGISATDAGISATDAGISATDAGTDEDYTTHIKTTTDAIPNPQQCTGCGLFATNGISAITLNWVPPAIGGSLTYNVYRCAGAGCSPQGAANLLKGSYTPGNPAAPTFTDTVSYTGTNCTTCYNVTYTYSVTALPQGGAESPYSNTATSEVTHLFVVADNQSVVYGSANPTPTFKVYGDVSGTLNTSQVTCAYTPAAPRNAGNYPINCSGPITVSPTNGVSYNVAYLVYVPGTLTISQKGLTITAGTATKTYDGNTTAINFTAPVVTGLVYTDSVNGFAEVYATPNAGTGITLSISAYTVNDQNNGLNYSVTLGTTTGTIIKAPSTTTITCPANVTYNGTAQTPCTATATGAGGLSASVSVTYTNNMNAGTATANATYSGDSNHFGSSATAVNFTILPAPVTATAGNYSNTYDGSPHSPTACAVTGAYTGSLTCANNPASVGPGVGSGAVTPVPGGDTLSNFAITPVNGNWSITKAASTTTITCPANVTYNGTAQTPCTATATGAGALSVPVLPVTYTNNTNAGTATANATYAGDSNHFGSSATAVNFTILPAPVTATAGSYGAAPYDGSPHSPSACLVTGVYTGSLNCANNPASVGPGAGSGAVTPVPGGDTLSNFAITPVNGNWSITKAPSTTTITCPANPLTYNGAAQTPCTATATGIGGLSAAVSVTYSNNTNAGTATANATYAGDSNHLASNATAVNFTISPAPVTLTAGSYSAPYNGSSNSPTACAVTGYTGGGLSCTNNPALVGPNVSMGVITPTIVTSNPSNFTVTPVNGAWAITPIPANITVTGYSVSFDGNAHTATATATGIGGVDLSADLNLSGTTHTNPGTYNNDPWSFTDPSGNYQSTNGPVNDTISTSIDLSMLSMNGVNYGTNTPAPPTFTNGALQLTNNIGSVTAAAWLGNAVPVNGAFTTTFQFQITPPASGPNSIGDGFAFVIQGNSNTTLGTTGGGDFIGYAGITNSLGIEFDTYYNADLFDPAGAHIGIQSNGQGANSSAHESPYNLGGPTLVSFADGNPHTATIAYDGNSTLTVSVDNTAVVTGTIPGSSTLSNFLGLSGGTAYIGFTTATGAASETTNISTWTWQPQ